MAEELRGNDHSREPGLETSPRSTYIQLLRSIQSNPYADDVWNKTVELALMEEAGGGGVERVNCSWGPITRHEKQRPAI